MMVCMTLRVTESTLLLNEKILLTGSEQEVTQFCNEIVSALLQEEEEGGDILHFVEKVITALDGYNPRNKNLRQWSNIHAASNYFHRYRETLLKNG